MWNNVTASTFDRFTRKSAKGSQLQLRRWGVPSWLESPSERDSIFFGHFAHILGDEWTQVRGEIEDGIQQIAERGFCLVDGAYHQDARAVAVPLVSPDGNSVMAMTCAGPSFQLSVNDLETDLGPRLVHLCRTLTPLI